jgi:mono/diheme cytochrome c family protein
MSRTLAMVLQVLAAELIVVVAGAQEEAAKSLSPEVARGRYLVQIAGCNDCHTAGYAFVGGNVDEKLWLLGDTLGWAGPWGTTYAANLRLTVNKMTAEQFTILARSELRPPMPWFSMRAMKDSDVKAIYAYLKHLGPAGEPAPAYLPPGREPKGPVIRFPEPPPGARTNGH